MNRGRTNDPHYILKVLFIRINIMQQTTNKINIVVNNMNLNIICSAFYCIQYWIGGWCNECNVKIESHLTYSYNICSCMLLMWCVLWRMFKMCWVGFFVFTTVTVKISVLWNIIPCSPMKVRLCVRGTYCLNLKGRRVSHARNWHEVDSKQNFTL